MSGPGEPWRVLRHEGCPRGAYLNMGIDEALLDSVAEGRSPPVMRFYMWDPSAISIGYFQSMDLEVDVSKCKEMGVDVVRRITGGGAVYHDRVGELTYSVVVPERYPGIPRDILESYRHICAGIIRGMEEMGVAASFRPINDIVVGDRKISGNAQTRRRGCILQHGTLLLDVDVETMFSILRVPDEKLKDKIIRNVKGILTSLKGELGEMPDATRVADLVEGGMTSSMGIETSPSELTPEEMSNAERISKERYSATDWIFRR